MAAGPTKHFSSISSHQRRRSMLGSELSSLQSLHRDKHSTSPADYSVDVISLKRYPQDSSVSPFKGQDFKHDKRTDNIYIDSDTEIDESSFAASLDNMKNCALVVSGSCGSGKAMLIRELTHCFQSTKSLNSFEKMLLINTCVHKKIFVAETAQELARIQKFQEPISEQTMVNSSGFRCLVAIVCGEDFIDKVESSLTLKRILKREYLPECTILLVCPTSQVEDVGSMLKVDHHYTLQGFTDPGRDHFLELHCCSEILVFLQQNQLLDLCNKPQVCVTIASMFSKAERSKQPKNLTVFLYTLISAQLFRSFDSEEKSVIGSVDQVRLEKLPESVDATFEATCLLAKEHVLRGHKCIDREESQQFLSSFSLELSAVSLKDVFRLGLVDVAIHPKSKCVYRFIDQTVVQFLTAFYLYKQPPLNQVMFLYKYSPTLLKNDFVLWLQIFFRLVGEDYTAHLTPYNPTKFMINTLVDVLVNSLELNDDHKNRYILIKCVHELQEKSQFRKLASKHPAILNFSVSAQELNNDIQPVLSLFTNLKSSSTEWIVNTSSKNMDLVMRLKHQVRGVPIIINTDEADDTYVYLSPRRTSAEVTRMYRDVDSSKQLMSCEEKTEKFNQFCCRAVREILQRVFPLYSEVKIKGDASNLSYVSFLTCKCFEEAFLKYIKLSPLQPVHFLPGPKKDLSKVPPESLNSTDRHNLLKHNGESLEVVIMLRPVVQKVEGAVPMTSEEFTLILSHDLVLEFSDHIVSDLVASEQCVEDYMIDGSHTERILPVLPIVQKTIYGRSQTAYPKSSLPPAQTPGVEPILQPTIVQEMPDQPPLHADLHGNPNTNGITHALAAPQAPTDEYPLSDHYRINGLSHAQAVGGTSVQPSQGVFVQNFAEQAGAEARVHQAVTSRKQTALRPGTVLFTSMPEKIPSDRIQPLPLQHSLIRKGGNGSIFSENLAGTALAVKKTSYRSKEYAILTKIHHKNIIPLLAYVWGEEHAESRRRYYVYHYLPKLSGDLARLVTDKEELSLYEFHKEHQYTDLKAMGAALGNIKYILSQVLEALKYLHTSHIAHRDLKASNVLIKFFCACENPLVCSCEVKYQVVVCDFDAAIELDSNDCAPVTSSSQFEIVPVGTNGFRSPESSMHTLANTPTVFSPLLSTKTDIYSFGILAMRLMISTDTPYSQRSMAMLLLYYHQLKGESTGRITDKPTQYHKLDRLTKQKLTGRKWLNFLRIGEDKVLRILKLNKLRSRMKWLRGGYEFVKQCLSVDPEARPTAGGLLVDPFLNWLASTCTMNHTLMMS